MIQNLSRLYRDSTLNQHWVVYRADWDCCFIISYNFWRFLTFTVLMVKPDILRQP